MNTTITTNFPTQHTLKKNDIILINGEKHKITDITSSNTIVIRNPYWFEVLWWRFKKWFSGFLTPNREE